MGTISLALFSEGDYAWPAGRMGKRASKASLTVVEGRAMPVSRYPWCRI